MNKIKVIEKGYTITVNSWENDGDYPSTKKLTVETIEEVKAYWDLLNLCKSYAYGDGNGLGNTLDNFDDKQLEAIVNTIKKHEIFNKQFTSLNYKFDDGGQIQDWFCDTTHKLLGSSEYYVCRVLENIFIVYSEEDVYLDTIEF